MTVSLFSFVDMYAKGLATLHKVLEKGQNFAAEQGVDEREMLGWRIADDMFPLWRQAQIAAIFGARWPFRAAGLGVQRNP